MNAASPTTPTLRSPGTIPVQFYRMKLPSQAISFCSEEGKVVFREALIANGMDCYFGLASQFRTQEEPAFCGLSTLVMVLNTLEVDPMKVWKGPWRWYHENMLDCCIPLQVIEKSGITFDQFACLAACNTLSVEAVRADEDACAEKFRGHVKYIAKRIDEIIVVSYSRSSMGQTGEGHFSPIGGYHEERDLVLILDVARFKYPPHWVPLTSLYTAMQKADKATGLPRGYMMLKKSLALPTLMFRFSSHLSITGSQLNRTNVVKFQRDWEEFLSTPSSSSPGAIDCGSSSCSSSFSVVREAEISKKCVEQLILIHGQLDPAFSLLDEQVDISCAADQISKEHRCAVRELLSALESLPVSAVVRSSLKLQSESTLTDLDPSSVRATNPEKNSLDESPTLFACNNSSVFRRLARWHYFVAILLFWPYEARAGSLGAHLQVRMSAQLASTDSQLLRNEMSLLKKQMSLVLSFVRKCDSESLGCRGCAKNV